MGRRSRQKNVGHDVAWDGQEWRIAAALVILTLAVFGQVTSHSFLNYDDDQFVTANEPVLRGLSGSSIWWAISSATLGWYPLTWLSHMLDVELWGLRAGAHLLVNALLHAVNACLLFAAMRRLTRAAWPSAFIAALFAIHPAHVESVAWVAERKDTLSTFFALLAILLYARAPERKGGVAAAMALSLAAKQMYTTLPFVLLLLDFWPLDRLKTLKDLRDRAAEKWPLFALTIAGVAIAFLGQHNLHAFNPVPLSARIANALVAYARYVANFFVPLNLALPYPLRAISAAEAAAAGAVVLAITACAVVFARRLPPLAAGWFWFLGTLVPVIGIVQIGGQSMADRYTYFSYIGLSIAVVFGVLRLARNVPREVLGAVGAVAIAVYAVLAFRQVGYWKDAETLFTRAIAVTGENAMAEYNLGQVLELNQPDRAIEHLRRSIDLTEPLVRAGAVQPDWFPQAYVGMATSMLMKARTMPPDAARDAMIRETITLNQRALQLDAATPHAKNNIGVANQMLGGTAPAASTDLYLKEGVALAQQAKFDDAVARYRAAVSADPSSVKARVYLGVGLIQANRIADGVAELRAAQSADRSAANRYLTSALRLPPDESNLDRVIANYAR
jgi:tetratricopeptide (TPR) repeat protein